jgi:nucleoside phosphorylase
LNNSKTKVGIICPLDDEYNACKEILDLKNESELSGRIVSERKEGDEYDPCSGKELGKIPSGDDESCTVINDPFYKEGFMVFSKHIQDTMAINIGIGNVACGEKDVKTQQLRQELHENFNALVCNWETSAVLSVTDLNEVKAFSFRVISDLADEDMKVSFDTNCNSALQKMLPVLKEFILGGWIQKFL